MGYTREDAMKYPLINKARVFAQKVHDAAGCTYGDNDENYMTHLEMVADNVEEYKGIFKHDMDFWYTYAAAYTHDTIEDAQQTFNNVKENTSTEVAKITLAVTDVHEENRLLRFLSTAPKIIKDHRSLVLKLCDIAANSLYGMGQKNSMYHKYQKEWLFKRHIFVTAANWYPDRIDKIEFMKLIKHIDNLISK